MPPIRIQSAPSSESASNGPLHPFQCQVCKKRFTRHENLKRHSVLHNSSEGGSGSSISAYPCSHCQTSFSRIDLRRRHMKKKHPELLASSSPGPSSVDAPVHIPFRTTRTSSSVSVAEDIRLDLVIDSNISDTDKAEQGFVHANEQFSFATTNVPPDPESASAMGDYFSSPENSFNIGRMLSTLDPTHSPTSLLVGEAYNGIDLSDTFSDLSASVVADSVDLFFTNVSHFFPFIHRATFEETLVSRPLLLAIVILGLQYSVNQRSFRGLANRCFHHARHLLDLQTSDTAVHSHTSSANNLALVQAYLLLQVYAIVYSCGHDTTYGLQMHNKSVELSRRGGLMEPLPTRPHVTSNLDSLWREYIKAESHKRTLFALYQVDVMWYHILSIPRSLSHLEIKHEMPCSERLWSQASSAAWAHTRLIVEPGNSDPTAPPTKYINAVRACLSPSPSSVPTLDSYGLSLVMPFFLSSVRELSGWATMTGRICFERFEALHSSTSTMEPAIKARAGDGPHAVVTEATWRMGMIELLMWSPSHTNGVVETTLNAALAAATHLGVTQNVAVASDAIESLDPHITWFLLYLDQPPDWAKEPPWLTVYGYKVTLIAWQLARGGCFDSLAKVGVSDMDGMVQWAKKVFCRRASWEVGRLIMKSLDELHVGREEL